ncbi:hypothetical protein IX317_000796 [Fusobacterium sp. DD29]|uniref:extracellular matrix regulator RemB n=1 Tax=unclassified Fusobacterium TaxID=2648384 RepID=UPI001B8BED0F|nr:MULTISPECIES: extracellular matrix/biofilm biosynthesis regulator RemA family protein [unclassified Fusobacterium]MBR8700766.1 hypothetical protein [Fusobacterium sp. DD45]MBR8710545.1 hypothetical protein [Fusobacterium sp. DD28]MBR8749134.1 hypothetical protein [Fusobacterium sp. DD29]MBR8751105.1 hypothetical protein [Fusobacterium sp. DD26]MBR8761400.1 hypothetical protein [Fusobacterium sp. DD25]
MYLYLEGDKLIPNEKVVLIIDYEQITGKSNQEFWEKEIGKKEVIDLSQKGRKSVVITDEEIYITSYGTQTLMNRGKEFFSIVGGIKSE